MGRYKGTVSGAEIDYVDIVDAKSSRLQDGALEICSHGALQGHLGGG